jgi:prepilin-type N-terminal cleavage/methylation domain-containing protein
MKLRISNFKFQLADAGGASFRKNRRSPSARAFTLIEIMIAIAVFTMVIAAIYATWAVIMKSSQVARDVAAQAQRQRITLRTIEDSLMAVQSFQASPQYYSFVVAGDEDASVLSFTARVPEVFPRNGKFASPITGRDFNLRRLTFSLEAAGGYEKNLVLRQNPVLMDLDADEQQFPLVLARNVRKFAVECWDPVKKDWVKEWLDTNTNSIPTLLRVNLVLGGNTAAGAAAPDFAVARLYSLPSQSLPAAVQNGGGAPITPAVPPPQIKP